MSKRKKLSENAALMQQWDFEKNVRGPECFTEYSHVKVWWKCIQGHSWEAMIFNRTYGDCCPYCVGKKVLTGTIRAASAGSPVKNNRFP